MPLSNIPRPASLPHLPESPETCGTMVHNTRPVFPRDENLTLLARQVIGSCGFGVVAISSIQLVRYLIEFAQGATLARASGSLMAPETALCLWLLGIAVSVGAMHSLFWRRGLS